MRQRKTRAPLYAEEIEIKGNVFREIKITVCVLHGGSINYFSRDEIKIRAKNKGLLNAIKHLQKTLQTDPFKKSHNSKKWSFELMMRKGYKKALFSSLSITQLKSHP